MKKRTVLIKCCSIALAFAFVCLSCFGCANQNEKIPNDTTTESSELHGDAETTGKNDTSTLPGETETTGQGGSDTPTPTPTLITEISTYDDLVAFAKSVNDGNHYQGVTVKLNNDIQLDDSKVWTPIGWGGKMLTNSLGQPMNFSSWFGGTFDGQGHIIRGSFSSQQEGYTGIFGMLSGATIKNLGLELDIALNYCNLHHGAIAGYTFNTVIEGCYFKGTITNAGSFEHEPDKQPDNNVGGFVGTAYGSLDIKNSYVDANMYRAARWSTGGFIGLIGLGATVTVTNCYSASTVSDNYGGDGDGCFLGNSESVDITVVNSYALDLYGDPLTGVNIPPKVFDEKSGFVNSTKLRGMAETLGAAFKTNPSGFPALSWETVVGEAVEVEPIYEISSIEDWKKFTSLVNSGYAYDGETVKLMADLDFSNYSGFVPVGWNEAYIEPGWADPVNLRDVFYFAGTFDGQGHSITGLSADALHGNWGLFGITYNAKIQNLHLEANFTDHLRGQKFFALLIGLAYETDVESCRVSGSYRTFGSDGFCTQMNGGVVGGAIGNVSIKNVICDANLTGLAQSEGGAFVGYLWTSTTNVTIENCYVYAPDVRALWWGDKDSNANSGVFAGGMQDGARVTVINSYACLTAESTVTNLTVADSDCLDSISKFVTVSELKTLASALGVGFKTVENGIPVLVWEDESASPTLPDFSETETDDSTPIYEINSIRDWNQFVNSIEAGHTYAGQVVKLGANLDFSKVAFRMAAKNATLDNVGIVGWGQSSASLDGVLYFAGTFDGQGFKISGLNLSFTHGYTGIFGVTAGATIKNLNLDIKITHTGNQWNNGTLIGYAIDTTVEACVISGSYVTSTAHLCGGIIGTGFGNITIRNCVCDLDLTEYIASYNGGMVGYAFGDNTLIVIENSYIIADDVKGGNNEVAFLVGGGTGKQNIINSFAVVTDLSSVTAPISKASGLQKDDASAIVTKDTFLAMENVFGEAFVKNAEGYPIPLQSN